MADHMISTQDRIRWSDMRAMLSQGVRLQPQDYRWFCQMKLAMNDINKRAIRNTCFRGPAKKGFGAMLFHAKT